MECIHKDECKYYKERELKDGKYLFVFSSDYSYELSTIQKLCKIVGIDMNDVVLETVKCSYSSWELDLYLKLPQVKKCKSYFSNLSNYKSIITFGNPASKLFSRKGNFYNYMEFPNNYNNISVYSTFPIYMIGRNKFMFEFAAYTLSQVKEGKFAPAPKYKVIEITSENEVNQLKKEIKQTHLIVFDTETNGLLPTFYKGEGKVLTAAVSSYKDRVYVFPEEHIDLFPLLKDEFEDINNIVVAHNIQYDAQVLKIFYGINIKGTLRDTMLFAYLLNEMQELSLKVLAPQVGLFYSEEEETQFKTGKIISKNKFLAYNAKDVMATHLLYIKFMKEAIQEDVYSVLNTILAPLQKVLIQIQYNGMSIDTDKLAQLQIEYKKYLDELQDKIQQLPEVKRYNQENEPLNINSTQQLVKLITDYFGIELKTTTKKGTLKMDKKILQSLKGKKIEKFTSLLLEYKEKSKLLSTYLKSFTDKDYVGKDNSLHSNFMISTHTGRLSSNSPNLQNIAGNKDIKSMLVPKKDNHILINADYSSCELRVSAGISQETSMINAFKDGLDLHAKVGAEVFGGEEKIYKEDKKKRTMVKAINFGLLYGMGAYTLGERIGVSSQEAEKYIMDYYRTYKNIQKTINYYKNFALENGYVVLPFGKRRYLLDVANIVNGSKRQSTYMNAVNNYLNKRKLSAEREAYNTIVQGTSVFFTYLSLIRIQNYINENNIDAYIVNTVHDSIVISIDKKQSYDFIKKIIYFMSDYNYEFLHTVPLRADVEVGYNYGHLNEVDKNWSKEEYMNFISNL